MGFKDVMARGLSMTAIDSIARVNPKAAVDMMDDLMSTDSKR